MRLRLRRFPGQRRTRRAALALVAAILGLQVLLAAPAHALGCDPPVPERPGTGLVGFLDAPAGDHGQVNSHYGTYSYAGTVWNDWTDSPVAIMCSQPQVGAMTMLGNQAFDVGKVLVAATNGVWYLLQSTQSPMSELDKQLAPAAKALYDNVFTRFLAVVLLLAAVWIMVRVWQGSLAHIATRVLWILGALWFAASSYLMPGAITNLLDGVLLDGMHEVQASMLEANGYDKTDGLPELLYNQVVWRTWVEGEFGSANSDAAHQYADPLLDSQAWKKRDTDKSVGPDGWKAKQQEFRDTAAKIKDTSAEPYFTGMTPTRLGTGVLGALRGFCFAFFPLLALTGQLLGMMILRIILLFAPVIGLAIIVYHRVAPGLLRGLGRAMGICLFMAASSTAYLWLLAIAMGIANDFLQILVMLVVTVVGLVMVRPVRQIFGMLGAVTSAAGMEHAGTKIASFGVLSRMWHREAQALRQERFLSKALGIGKNPSTSAGGSRHRPESDSVEPPRQQPEFVDTADAPPRSRRAWASRDYQPDYRPARGAVSAPVRELESGPVGRAWAEEFSPQPGAQPGGRAETRPAGPGQQVRPGAPDTPSTRRSSNTANTPPSRRVPPTAAGAPELIVPSERERQRAEGTPDIRVAAPRPDAAGGTVYSVYVPSENNVRRWNDEEQQFENEQARNRRPESDEWGS